eukprot:c39678_g1_i1 orf=86-337(-)
MSNMVNTVKLHQKKVVSFFGGVSLKLRGWPLSSHHDAPTLFSVLTLSVSMFIAISTSSLPSHSISTWSPLLQFRLGNPFSFDS